MIRQLCSRVRTLLGSMSRTRSRQAVPEPEAVATAEHYRDEECLVIHDGENPLAWVESDTHCSIEQLSDLCPRAKRRERTPRRPYNRTDK